MTKGELLRLLDPFTPELDITVMSSEGISIDIKKLGYQVTNARGVGEVAMVPMGSHLPEDWEDIG